MNSRDSENAEQYDIEAAESGWFGPAVAFGLAFAYTRPGQAILDIGIGTGLGSALFQKAGLAVTGIDISEEMLDICRKKGWAERLVCHDLTCAPYPFVDASFDHAVSTGVFQFFPDLDLVCRETGRVVRGGGVFVFVTGDRGEGEDARVVIGPELTGTGHSVTMYRHSPRQVAGWLAHNGFCLIDSLDFSVWMDRARTKRLPACAYIAEKQRAPNGDGVR